MSYALTKKAPRDAGPAKTTPVTKAARFKIGWLDRFLAFCLWLMAVVFVSALVHIVSILALPQIAQKDAYSRLAAMDHANLIQTQTGQVSLLPAALPGREFAPFTDPALVQGICLFDLDRGPLELSADIPNDELLTFSFRTRTGNVFYSITDRAATHKKLDVIVLTAKQLETVEANDDDEQLPQELRLTAPQKKGFVMVNALVAFPSERANVEALVKSITCETTEDSTP